MPGETIQNSNKPYLSIVGGNFVQTVAEGTPGATRREYETRDKKTGVKYEFVWSNWTGVIESITFKDTDFGQMCVVEMSDAIINLNTSSNFFTDFACKIFNADLTKPIKLHPYSMETEAGKNKRGISMSQFGNKLYNYFYDAEKKEALHGFPKPESDRMDKDDWKVYFLQVKKFLVNKLSELTVPKSVATEPDFGQDEEVDIDSLPF